MKYAAIGIAILSLIVSFLAFSRHEDGRFGDTTTVNPSDLGSVSFDNASTMGFLSGTTLIGSTWASTTRLSISSGTATTTLQANATSTIATGLNLLTGCVTLNGGGCIGSGSGSGTVNSGTTGQIPYYAGSGTAITATSSVFLSASGNLSVATSSDKAFSVNIQSNSNGALGIYNNSGTQVAYINNNGDLYLTNGAIQAWAQVLFNSPVFAQFQDNVANISMDFKTVTGTGDIVFTPNATDLLTLSHNGMASVATSSQTAILTVQLASSTASTASAFDVWGLMNTVEWLFQRIDQWGHLVTSGPTPGISGGTSSVSGNDRNGTITVTGTALTSVTLTFAHPYKATPECQVSDNTTASVADVSSISTTAVTFGLSVGINSGALYYNCEMHQ